jgi:hypothetical protein
MSTIDLVDSADQPEAHHVDVERAEQAFAELARSLSRRSYNQGTQHAGDPDATVHATPASTINHDSKDIEKGGNTESTQFDLREYLTTSNDKNQEAGIYHKHVGVTWDNLQVEGIGGLDNKFYVKTFGRKLDNEQSDDELLLICFIQRRVLNSSHFPSCGYGDTLRDGFTWLLSCLLGLFFTSKYYGSYRQYL